MKIMLFAGGSGKRFWPLSRRTYPKQFRPLIEGRSTIELMSEKVAKKYGWQNIYFATNERVVSLLKEKLPLVEKGNIHIEPVRRDLGPSVGLAMMKLKKMGFAEDPVTILWTDNFPANSANFLKSLEVGEKLIKENNMRVVFLGEKPTFPNENVGWIELEEELLNEDGISGYRLSNFKYRPDLSVAKEWIKDPRYVWNTGYFITSPEFILAKYKENNPELFAKLDEISQYIGTDRENEKLSEIYPTLESITFDHVLLEKLKKDETVVLKTEFEWTDPGTLYALKQYLQTSDEANVEIGNVYSYETKDSLLFNENKDQILTAMGLEGFVVVNTCDALLVCPKEYVVKISKMLEEWVGTEREKYL